MKKTSTFWQKFHKLHLGLYVLFAFMVYFGSTTAFVFEKFSLIDSGILKTEWANASVVLAKGGEYKVTQAFLDNMQKVFALQKHVDASGKVKYESRKLVSGFYFLFLLAWLWPLYRHQFSEKPRDISRVERRIIQLPVAVFVLGWVLALQRYLENVSFYSQYGPVPDKVKVVYALSALLMGAFVSYLNLELTGLYIRQRIAKPFFLENNPYGLKSGFAINLTLRYALMLFSLAMVPLLLCLYVPIYANLDAFSVLASNNDLARQAFFSYENIRMLVPILIVAFLTGVMLVFQAVSIMLYRFNVQAPVSALVKRMKAVAAGDFTCKTSVLYADELGQLKGHFNQMLDGLVERDHIKDTFGRYVSLEIAEKIMKSGKVNLAGEEIQATVLFSDIRGFTPLSETMPPVELIKFLNEYFAYMTKPIADNKGVINKFIGDAVMAIFSPVFGVEDHQEAAVRAALGMKAALKEFNAQKRHPEVFFGVGVHSGGLVAGNVGTAARLEYTVLGDTVNVASRIESQTKTAATEILLSDAVIRGIDQGRFPGVKFLEGAPVLMKGKSKPMILYKVETAA
ncbi:MAG: adenylate/guanylate cyclase domain-containing protein [Elusimicrobiales bacterium]|nr:adenylate/guanylate cyclase domain-containing protein [Elusimicrobiales bacterium]